MSQIFISYPRDKGSGQQVGRELYALLKQRQIPVFFDEGGIAFGERWLETLKAAIAESKVVLWLVSAASQDRKWQEREFNEAERLNLRIIPVLVEDVPMPMQVNDQQAAFLFGEQKAEQLDKLLAFLETELGIDRIKPLMRDALAAKNNESYDKAMLKWREVLELSPGHQRATQEISVLQGLLDKQSVGQQLLMELVTRLADINPVFNEVASVLNTAARHQHAEAIINHSRAFLNGELGAAQYIVLCETLLSPLEEAKPVSRTIKLFISYAHEDEKPYRTELDKRLKAIQRKFPELESWYDRKLFAGEKVHDKILQQLEAADIVVLLISPDFMDSDYCFSHELKVALQQYEANKNIVIPVVIRTTADWHDFEIGNHTALPTDGKPLAKWEDKDEFWADVQMGISRQVERLLNAQG